MPNSNTLTKAFLQEITWNENSRVVASEGRKMTVQFNPETLKVTVSNQIAGDDNKGGAAIQFSSRGTTKLSFDLWFDVTAKQPDGKTVNDVRKLTEEVVKFMKTEESGSGDDTQYIPPGVRFQWGSFLFEGVMESLNETFEFFSEDGKPLRASVSVNLTKQDVKVAFPEEKRDDTPGTRPQQQSKAGETLHDVVARTGGRPENWQATAIANGVEDPLRLSPGTLLKAVRRVLN